MKQRVWNKILDFLGDLWGFCWVLAITFVSLWVVGKTLNMLINLIGG